MVTKRKFTDAEVRRGIRKVGKGITMLGRKGFLTPKQIRSIRKQLRK